jgi:hypothetical protein
MPLEEYFCFVCDKNGLWYKIPVRVKNTFDEFSENNNPLIKEFSKYRSMHPCNYMFNDIFVLKESK